MRSSFLGRLWLSDRLQRACGPASLLLIAALFLIDLAVPLGYSYALFHVIAILLSFFSRSRGWIMAAAASSILVTLLAPALTALPAGTSWQLVAFNRAITVLVCQISGLVGLECLRILSRTRNIYDELQQTSSMLQIASRAGRLGGWIVELETQALKWTDETARIHGYSVGQVPDLETAFNHYPPEHQRVIREAISTCAGQGLPFDLELQLTTLQGEKRWVRSMGAAVRDRSGRIVRVHGAIQDIQDVWNTRLELVRRAERWNQLAEAMPLIVWTATAKGEVDFFSRHLER